MHNRALACKEWIHRPFLYYVLHKAPEDPDLPLALPLAERCIELCIEHQLRCFPHHRHHGTWLVARTSLSRALLILAAMKSGKVTIPDMAREALEHARWTVSLWSAEAPDLKWGLAVLDDLMHSLLAGD